jgi:hypothetical protein
MLATPAFIYLTAAGRDMKNPVGRPGSGWLIAKLDRRLQLSPKRDLTYTFSKCAMFW